MPLVTTALAILVFFANAANSLESMHLPDQTQQVILVVTPSWNSNTGTLTMFQKSHGNWTPAGAEIPVVLGRNGLAWGAGSHHDSNDGPIKVEGDGRAPAGIFKLGPAFGYDPLPPNGSKLPYRQATAADIWVSDPESPQYNQWVALQSGVDPNTRWTSFEDMKRPDQLYQLGMVVQYNTDPVVKNAGSAIFLHIWKEPGSPTAGCTAMAQQNLLALLQWLDPARHPLLIQLPSSELEKFDNGAFKTSHSPRKE
jgi:L,D-peptidoglycan transpeptidase YkuD (ErfK/YbiS/YcfS/YnhG family)